MLTHLTIDLLQLPRFSLDFDLIRNLKEIIKQTSSPKFFRQNLDKSNDFDLNLKLSKSTLRMLEKLDKLGLIIDILFLTLKENLSIKTATKISLTLNKIFEYAWLKSKLQSLHLSSPWELAHQDILLQSIRYQKINLVKFIHQHHKKSDFHEINQEDLVKLIKTKYEMPLHIYFQSLKDLKNSSASNLTSLSVVINKLNFLSIMTK